MSVIRFENVLKAYDDVTALEDFSTQVDRGEMKIVLGGSGSGKSTILKLVLGLVRPDRGSVFIDEQDITNLPEKGLLPFRSEIGMVFQEGALFDSLTVGENVSYRLREQRSHTPSEMREIVTMALGFVGLKPAIDKMPAELSGGMRRRVAIARALVGEPRIMLFDEPTAGLDPITGRAICELIMRLRDLQNATSIMVTHDLNSAMTLAGERAVEKNGDIHFVPAVGTSASKTQFLMLVEGKILFEGTAEELRSTENSYIREFLD